MTETIETIEKVSSTELLEKLNNASLEEAEILFEQLSDAVQNTLYTVKLSVEEINSLKKYIITGAKWKFTECLGIIEVEKALNEAKKAGVFCAKALPIEAIYYYLSKVEGTGKKADGFGSVEEFIKILFAMNAVVEQIKAESEKIKTATFILAAKREGISTDDSVTTA